MTNYAGHIGKWWCLRQLIPLIFAVCHDAVQDSFKMGLAQGAHCSLLAPLLQADEAKLVSAGISAGRVVWFRQTDGARGFVAFRG